jgi:YHS domain-containing protein
MKKGPEQTSRAEYTEKFEGKTYGFCSQWCKDSSYGNPRRYIEMSGSKGMLTPRDIPEKH